MWITINRYIVRIYTGTHRRKRIISNKLYIDATFIAYDESCHNYMKEVRLTTSVTTIPYTYPYLTCSLYDAYIWCIQCIYISTSYTDAAYMSLYYTIYLYYCLYSYPSLI